jgi:hypothetical protein
MGQAKQKNYTWESPMKMAERWPEYRKQKREAEQRQKQSNESRPLNPYDVVTYENK